MRQFSEDLPYQPLTDYIFGQYMGLRTDAAGQLAVSVSNSAFPDRATPAKVGYHVDTWEDEGISLMIVNAGPGERWHCIVPACTRPLLGGAGRQERITYFEQRPGNDMMVFGIRLDPPTDDYFEAILNSPVAYILHEGSTLFAAEPSTAAFTAVDPIHLGAYPSPLA
jgi:hypothetical protein